ncbi:MAG: hypothetical protein OYH77_00460 [Pseudomonadota bacterium]|nr:hypothetical protein [Pseudomonadota bacterium]
MGILVISGRWLRHMCLAVGLLTLSTGITMMPLEEVMASPRPTLMDVKSMTKIKNLALGTAVALPLLVASFIVIPKHVHNLMTPIHEQTGDSYLDTIIRFEDEIIGAEFYYRHHGRVGSARAVEWSLPYNDITLETSLGDLLTMPVSALQGKRLDLHPYEGADVVYFNRNNELFQGIVLEVYDNQMLKVLTEAKLKNLHTVSDDHHDFQRSYNYINFTDTLQLQAELY